MPIFSNEQISKMTNFIQSNQEAQFSLIILNKIFEDERVKNKKDDLILIFLEHLDNIISMNKIPKDKITESDVSFLAENLYESLIPLVEKTTLK